jgi:hypothetical protein
MTPNSHAAESAFDPRLTSASATNAFRIANRSPMFVWLCRD